MERMGWTNSVTINISSKTLTTDELALALGLTPGEATAHRHPNISSLLIATAEADESELWPQLYATADKAKELLERAGVLSGQINMNINCHVNSGGAWRGIVLPPDLLKSLSDLGLHVGFVFKSVQQPGHRPMAEETAPGAEEVSHPGPESGDPGS